MCYTLHLKIATSMAAKRRENFTQNIVKIASPWICHAKSKPCGSSIGVRANQFLCWKHWSVLKYIYWLLMPDPLSLSWGDLSNFQNMNWTFVCCCPFKYVLKTFNDCCRARGLVIDDDVGWIVAGTFKLRDTLLWQKPVLTRGQAILWDAGSLQKPSIGVSEIEATTKQRVYPERLKQTSFCLIQAFPSLGIVLQKVYIHFFLYFFRLLNVVL